LSPKNFHIELVWLDEVGKLGCVRGPADSRQQDDMLVRGWWTPNQARERSIH
jgi:hypothetical protein